MHFFYQSELYKWIFLLSTGDFGNYAGKRQLIDCTMGVEYINFGIDNGWCKDVLYDYQTCTAEYVQNSMLHNWLTPSFACSLSFACRLFVVAVCPLNKSTISICLRLPFFSLSHFHSRPSQLILFNFERKRPNPVLLANLFALFEAEMCKHQGKMFMKHTCDDVNLAICWSRYLLVDWDTIICLEQVKKSVSLLGHKTCTGFSLPIGPHSTGLPTKFEHVWNANFASTTFSSSKCVPFVWLFSAYFLIRFDCCRPNRRQVNLNCTIPWYNCRNLCVFFWSLTYSAAFQCPKRSLFLATKLRNGHLHAPKFNQHAQWWQTSDGIDYGVRLLRRGNNTLRAQEFPIDPRSNHLCISPFQG